MPTEHDDLMQNFGQNNLDLEVTPLPKINMFETPKSSVLSRRVLHDDWKDLSLDEFFEVDDPHEYDSQPDKIGMVFFQGNWDTQTIAGILSLIDATILIPTNCSVRDTAETKHPVFLAKLINISNLMNNWKTNEKIKQSPIADKLLAAFESNDSGIGAVPLNDKRQADTLMVTDIVRKNQKQALSFLQSGRDKINFLYSLCSNNIRNIKIDQGTMKYEEILRHFVLLQINRLENAKTEQEQNDLFDQIMANIMLEDSDLKYKIDQFKGTLGQIKFSKPLSMPVVLDNGTRADLFKLDKSTHKIMHAINVSKINESIDLSNIVINGDFICARAKASIVLPKQINGLLDCSYWDDKVPTSTIRIPNGATAVNFTGVIKSFKDLGNIDFPDSVHEVLLLNSTLKQVSKDAAELHAFETFTAQYPQIQIWDSKHNTWLQDTLVPVQTEQKSKPMVGLVTVVPQAKPALEDKTPDWLTRKEIVSVFANEFSGTDVERLVKLATKTSYQNIKTENKLVDGTSVLCIHKNCLDEVKRNMLEIMNADSQRASQPKQVVNVVIPEKAQKAKKVKKQKPVKITKFISQKVWNDIKDSCNDSAHLIYSVLEHINKVNIDFTKEKATSGPVQYIDKNGQIQVVPTLHIEDICAITQSIGNRYTGKRIIWTMNSHDKVLVAIRFMETHADNINDAKEYKETRKYAAKVQNINGENITRDLVVTQGYLNVADLLEQYKPKTNNKVVVKKEAVATVQKKSIAHNVPKEPITEQKKDVVHEEKPRRPHVKRGLTDMKSVDAEVKAFIKRLDIEIAEKSATLGEYKNNIESQETIAKEILKCIEYKKSLLKGLSK